MTQLPRIITGFTPKTLKKLTSVKRVDDEDEATVVFYNYEFGFVVLTVYKTKPGSQGRVRFKISMLDKKQQPKINKFTHDLLMKAYPQWDYGWQEAMSGGMLFDCHERVTGNRAKMQMVVKHLLKKLDSMV